MPRKGDVADNGISRRKRARVVCEDEDESNQSAAESERGDYDDDELLNDFDESDYE